MTHRCAYCGADLARAVCTGESSLYSPDGPFILCEPCWLSEDALIDAVGTNDIPALLAFYADRRVWGLKGRVQIPLGAAQATP